MITSSPRWRSLAAAVLAGVLLTIGFAAPAQADTANGFTATLTATKGAITVDLSEAVYAAPPTSLYIQAVRNGCTAASPCWAEQDAQLTVTSAFNGSYTLTGLKADTRYQISIYGYSAGDFTGYATTPVDVNAAPSAYPLASVSSDGLHATLTAQAEYDEWNIHDGGTIAALRYNVDAYVNGVKYRRVLTGVTAGGAHKVSGLPKHKTITFTETDVNSVGESPESTPSGSITLAPLAPGSFSGKAYPGRTSVVLTWTKPSAVSGHLSKFVVRLHLRSKSVYRKTVRATVRDLEIDHLKRHSHYVVSVTATNSYGLSTTIRGVLTTK